MRLSLRRLGLGPLSLALCTLGALGTSACGGDDPAAPADAGVTPAPDAASPDATSPGEDASTSPDATADAGRTTFTVSGAVSFDWVPAVSDEASGGASLDYAAIETRAARRVVVEAVQAVGLGKVAETLSDDEGRFSMEIPLGTAVKVRMRAETRATRYAADGIAPDVCDGASWEAVVVDNTSRGARYAVDGTQSYSSDATDANVRARLSYRTGGYSDRSAAPFTLIDTFVRQLEVVCEGLPDVDLPLLQINWSENNVPSGDDIAAGELGTSFYSQDDDGVSNLYLVGQAEVDTDEYDAHVVAHEMGHFLEDRLYRSDSQGGSHWDGDTLEPATAFSEGFGNAISGMTFDDPVYVDTNGVGQAEGWYFDVSNAPVDDDRGIYSEASAQYLLWSLWENRDRSDHSGSFDHIHDVLRDHQRTTPAFANALSFAAYYNQTFGGDAEQLRSLWWDGLGTPFDALCDGVCTGQGDRADPFDLDNDIGREYAGDGVAQTPRGYPQGSTTYFDAEFWRTYRTLLTGTNAATGHDRTYFGMHEEPGNKLGAVRFYRWLGTNQSMRITIDQLGAASCNQDVLDLAVYLRGREVASNYELDGCPTVTFPATAGEEYVIVVWGYDTELPSWRVTVGPRKKTPPVDVGVRAPVVEAGKPFAVTIDVGARRGWSSLATRVRGIDGVTIDGGDVIASTDAKPGARISRTVTAVVPAGVAGWLVVDVRGSIGGRTFSTSLPYPLRAPGAKRALRVPGTLVEHDGERLIVTTSAE
ncbi:hypothetical protein L6R52_31200 [Myxococcota bacterium]|nr:hypothetical protein [Myxococcota bacterium]